MPGQALQPSLQAGNDLSATQDANFVYSCERTRQQHAPVTRCTQSSCKVAQGFSKSVNTWRMHNHAPCFLSVLLSRQWTALIRNARQRKFMSIPVYARVMHVDMTTHSKGTAHSICSFIDSASFVLRGTATQVFIHWSRSSCASAISQRSALFTA